MREWVRHWPVFSFALERYMVRKVSKSAMAGIFPWQWIDESLREHVLSSHRLHQYFLDVYWLFSWPQIQCSLLLPGSFPWRILSSCSSWSRKALQVTHQLTRLPHSAGYSSQQGHNWRCRAQHAIQSCLMRPHYRYGRRFASTLVHPCCWAFW